MSDDTTTLDDYISDEEIKKYNEKIQRFSRRNLIGMPSKISRSDIEKMDSDEIAQLKEDIEDFMRKDATRVDKISGATKYFKRYYEKRYEALEKKKAELREELGGSTEKGTMGAINKLNLAPRKNRFDTMTPQQQIKSLRGIESQLKKDPEEYKQNYIDSLKTQFGEGSLEYNLIKEVVDKIDGKTLYLLHGENSDLQIDFIYSKGEKLESKAQVILDAFKEEGFITEDIDIIDELSARLEDIWDI